MDENCTSSQMDCQNAMNGGSPEITADDLRKMELYASCLAVPARRNHEDLNVLQGKKLFNEIGCGNCHVASFTTGSHDKFEHLSFQKIWPYTDMLLHDMGEGLADYRPDFEADGYEWRTPPLWGIGLFQTVNHHTYFLHDGRARNLTEAIMWHGGEAENTKDKFANLKKQDRDNLLAFLNSL